MNARLSTIGRTMSRSVRVTRRRLAFTMIEILVVLVIIGVLITILGATATVTIRKAREAATTALLQKINDLLDERLKGFERATKSRDFERIVQQQARSLETSGIFGVRKSVIAAIARKDFFRQQFPQRWEDLADGEDRNWNGIADPGESAFSAATNSVPDVLERVPGAVLAKLQSQGLAIPTNPVSATAARHETESAELLYYMLTQMEVLGVPPVGESEFSTSEVKDTDGDGLLEFVDGWGRPLRFYRWPTRLLKPNGVFGLDGTPGVGQPGVAGTDDDGNGLVDDAWEIGWPGSDDYRALNPINTAIPAVTSDPNTPYHLPRRDLAGLLIDGVPPKPITYLSGGNLLRYRYDTVDEDPDDPYGMIVLEMKRLARPTYPGVPAINVLALGGYVEGVYPTLDTFHAPLVVSAGADAQLGLFEPHVFGPNSGGVMQYGVLAQAIFTGSNPNDIPSTTFDALTDNLTNRNRRAGKGK